MPINYSKYPDNWKSEIVPRILERDGHKCKFCGLRNKQIVYSYKLRIQDSDGRYKLKTFWTESESDLSRIKEIAYPGSIKKVKVVLTIAHLDHDEDNNNVKDERLAALCQYCHLNYDAKEKLRRKVQGDK